MNLMNLVCTIFTLYQIAFCYFFQATEKGKTDNDIDFNPLMPGGNKKVTYTSASLQLKPPGLFKYVWPFCYYQALKR